MKISKKCPKCGSTDIIRILGDGKNGTQSNSILTGYTLFSMVNINRYICCECGFSEEWIDKKDIDTVKKSVIVKPID